MSSCAGRFSASGRRHDRAAPGRAAEPAGAALDPRPRRQILCGRGTTGRGVRIYTISINIDFILFINNVWSKIWDKQC